MIQHTILYSNRIVATSSLRQAVGKGPKRKLRKRDFIHHHLLETISETADVLELRPKLLYTTPSTSR